ncbi:MAG: hypothetical protein ABI035_13285 [Gemmatimonadaceae bacterium]
MTALAAWLDDTASALESAIVRRAMCDIGIVEMPPGSNRSERIDEYVGAVGSPPASRWCAAALAAWWRECGAMTPTHDAGSCNSWLAWAIQRKMLNQEPRPGRAVIYGSGGSASHIGVIVRVTPLLLSVEANTSVGGDFDPDGVAVALKQVSTTRVLGYIQPEE